MTPSAIVQFPRIHVARTGVRERLVTTQTRRWLADELRRGELTVNGALEQIQESKSTEAQPAARPPNLAQAGIDKNLANRARKAAAMLQNVPADCITRSRE
jgi:hypothetical protein